MELGLQRTETIRDDTMPGDMAIGRDTIRDDLAKTWRRYDTTRYSIAAIDRNSDAIQYFTVAIGYDTIDGTHLGICRRRR